MVHSREGRQRGSIDHDGVLVLQLQEELTHETLCLRPAETHVARQLLSGGEALDDTLVMDLGLT